MPLFFSSFFPSSQWMVVVDQGFLAPFATFGHWMIPRGQVVSFPHSLANAQVAHSSVTMFLALSEVVFMLHAMTLSYNRAMYFVFPDCFSLKMNFSCHFFFLELFHIFYEWYFICFFF
jgi:hypothetical protein